MDTINSENRNFSLGIDLHKRFAYWHLIEGVNKTIWHGKVETKKEKVLEQLSSLRVPLSSVKAVIEPVEQWGWYADIMDEKDIDVSLADSLRTRLIADSKKKGDKVDAKVLAELLHTGYLPKAFLAPKDIRDLRELLRYRVSVVRHRAKLKNRVHSILGKHGIIFPYTDVFGKIKASHFFEEIELRDMYRTELESVIRLGKSFSEEIDLLDKEIEKRAKEDEDTRILETIPGIGSFRALLLKAEVGDFSRFPSGDKLASYAGLVSSSYSSGGKLRLGRITKQGSRYLRWALVQAATGVKPCWGQLYEFYIRIKEKKGVKVARVALARKLLTIAWHLIKKREPFRATLVSSGGLDQ